MVLLRKVLGDALRARRLAQRRTLREVSTAANVSLGYLSEIERGHKEASSELLASICDALGAPLSEMLGDVSATFALAEQMEFASVPAGSVPASVPAAATASIAASASVSGDAPEYSRIPLDTSVLAAELDELELIGLEQAVSDGDVTVEIHSDGPLRTTLITKRVPPGQRFTEKIYVG